MTDIMLDLETLSSRPDAAIVSIGACTFRSDGEAMPEYERERRLIVFPVRADMAKGGRADIETMLWWGQQGAAARDMLDEALRTQADPVKRLLDLIWFCTRPGQTVRVWGNGADFDNVVISEALRRHGLMPSWDRRNNRCFRTLKALAPDVPKPPNDRPHCADSDAEAQARHAEAIFAHLKGKS